MPSAAIGAFEAPSQSSIKYPNHPRTSYLPTGVNIVGKYSLIFHAWNVWDMLVSPRFDPPTTMICSGAI